MEVANNDVLMGADTINVVAIEVTELTQVTVGNALVRIARFITLQQIAENEVFEFCNLRDHIL